MFLLRCNQVEPVVIQQLKSSLTAQPTAVQLPVTSGKEDFLGRHTVRREWVARDAGMRRDGRRSNHTPSMLQVKDFLSFYSG